MVATAAQTKPVVTNKRGNPYIVVWKTHKIAHVFHPGELEYYKVVIDTIDNMTCRYRSDYNILTGEGKCWPFSEKGTCVHCDAVQNSIDLGERPEWQYPLSNNTEPSYIVVPRPSRQYPEPSQVPADEPLLEDIITGEPHSREAVKQARKFARNNNIRLEDLY